MYPVVGSARAGDSISIDAYGSPLVNDLTSLPSTRPASGVKALTRQISPSSATKSVALNSCSAPSDTFLYQCSTSASHEPRSRSRLERLVTPRAAWPLQLPLPADVHGDQEGDSDHVENPVDPMAVREVPEAHTGLDRSDQTDNPTLLRKGLHPVSVPATRNLNRKRPRAERSGYHDLTHPSCCGACLTGLDVRSARLGRARAAAARCGGSCR